MTNPIHHKHVIITGGTRGIGRAIAERLLDEGAAVAICGRSQAGVDRAVAEMTPRGRIVGAVADVQDPDSVAKFFQFVDESLGALDVLINNAGIGIFKRTADLTIADWKQILETNLSGTFYCSHQALARMRIRNAGYIINMSSLAGKNPFVGGAAYNASKFGLNGFTEAMMLDHRHDGIRVSYVMPGSVATEFNNSGAGDWKIQPEDIAEIVGMLLRMPDRTLVSRVEVRPSRPKK